MHPLSLVLAAVWAALAVQASHSFGPSSHLARHAHLSRSGPRADRPSLSTRSDKKKKRCPNRRKSSSSSTSSSTTTTKSSSTHTSSASTHSASAKVQDAVPTTEAGTTKGVMDVKSTCGSIGATAKTTKDTGPNGSLKWLNCGVDGDGWRPPMVKVSDLVSADLSSSIKKDGSPFKACSKYVSMFEKYGEQYGLPPIMLASFALQESSCNPETVGGGGEQGLMQITRDKCHGAPDGDCRDPDFNIKTGAAYFKNTLDSNGGNVVKSVGEYNGWSPGMTYAKATAARKSSCCLCQNNLDYLHQFFNGWMQNIDAYDKHLGVYFNLDVCH